MEVNHCLCDQKNVEKKLESIGFCIIPEKYFFLVDLEQLGKNDLEPPHPILMTL